MLLGTSLWPYTSGRPAQDTVLPKVINQSPTLQTHLTSVLLDHDLERKHSRDLNRQIEALMHCPRLEHVSLGLNGWLKKVTDADLNLRLSNVAEATMQLRGLKAFEIKTGEERIEALLPAWRVKITAQVLLPKGVHGLDHGDQ
jgi:hypothetical protein